MIKKLLIILLLLVSIPACAKHKDVEILGCSAITTQEIYYIQSNIERQGYEMPGSIICDTKIIKRMHKLSNDSSDFENTAGYYNASMDLIYLRENISNEIIARTLLHEIGHYNHRIKLGNEKFEKIDETPMPEFLNSMIKVYINHYAATSRLEFVAEYFALTQMGRDMPQDLEDFYKECEGP